MQYATSAPVRVLFASSQEHDRKALQNIFSHSRWELEMVKSRGELERKLNSRLVPVVMCDCKLPDGTWRDVYHSLSELARKPVLIVTCAHADDSLWAEVLNLGAYDVLAKPFHGPEVFRVISLAWRHSIESWRAKLAKQPEKAAAARTNLAGYISK